MFSTTRSTAAATGPSTALATVERLTSERAERLTRELLERLTKDMYRSLRPAGRAYANSPCGRISSTRMVNEKTNVSR
ncbi:hypothetical protein SALBM311S_03062 [Streptomyces alboniger]